MKKSILLITTTLTLLSAAQKDTNIPAYMRKNIHDAVKRVETAREETFTALKSMVASVDKARNSSSDNNRSIYTKIIETRALSQIANHTANVEITKAKAMLLITQAIDTLDPSSMQIIANAVASVEIAKAKAKKAIITATKKVEISKTKPSIEIKHPQETLTIAKNLSAIQIAKSVAKAALAKAVSDVEVSKSSIENRPSASTKNVTKGDQKMLEDIKAKAKANISSYLANIEVTKFNMLVKIAQEVAKVEVAKRKRNGMSTTEVDDTNTYPNTFIIAN